jgi:hypothetical protein
VGRALRDEGLPVTVVAQGDVGVALDAGLAVPGGLAVPDENQLGDAVLGAWVHARMMPQMEHVNR